MQKRRSILVKVHVVRVALRRRRKGGWAGRGRPKEESGQMITQSFVLLRPVKNEKTSRPSPWRTYRYQHIEIRGRESALVTII